MITNLSQLCSSLLIKLRPRAHFFWYSSDISTLTQTRSYFCCVTWLGFTGRKKIRMPLVTVRCHKHTTLVTQEWEHLTWLTPNMEKEKTSTEAAVEIKIVVCLWVHHPHVCFATGCWGGTSLAAVGPKQDNSSNLEFMTVSFIESVQYVRMSTSHL